MVRKYKLTNGLVIGILGENSELIFDDNTVVQRHSVNSDDISMHATVPFNITLRNIKFRIADEGYFILTEQLKADADKMVLAYTKHEVDLIICPPHCINDVYEYIVSLYPNVPIYSPSIFDFDNGIAVCRIDLFIRYNPKKLKYDDTI